MFKDRVLKRAGSQTFPLESRFEGLEGLRQAGVPFKDDMSVLRRKLLFRIARCEDKSTDLRLTAIEALSNEDAGSEFTDLLRMYAQSPHVDYTEGERARNLLAKLGHQEEEARLAMKSVRKTISQGVDQIRDT